MYRHIAMALVTVLAVRDAAAQSSPDNIAQTADLMVRLCVGAGTSFKVSRGVNGDAKMSFRALKADGSLGGKFDIEKSSAEGLVHGLDNSMSRVTADEADKVRECLKPVRERLLDILLPVQKGSLPTPPSVNCNSYGPNLGTINNSCGNVIVTQPDPSPTFRIVSQDPPKLNDQGAYTINALMEIKSPYPIPKFIFMTKTPDVLKIEARSIGGITTAAEGVAQGYHYSAVDNANGRYYVAITLKNPSQVQLEYQIQQ